MIIEYNYQRVVVPQDIIEYCDYFTYDAKREELRYRDCIYMHMGYYGNDPEHLKQLRSKIVPLWD